MKLPTLKTILLHKSDHILTITMNQPRVNNAFNDQQYLDFVSALNFGEDPAISVIIVTGEGTFFSSGANLKEFQKEVTDEYLENGRQHRLPVHQFANALLNCTKPLIAGNSPGRFCL